MVCLNNLLPAKSDFVTVVAAFTDVLVDAFIAAFTDALVDE